MVRDTVQEHAYVEGVNKASYSCIWCLLDYLAAATIFKGILRNAWIEDYFLDPPT